MREDEVTCDNCHGAGLLPGGNWISAKLCPTCNGHGVLVLEKVEQKRMAYNATFTMKGQEDGDAR